MGDGFSALAWVDGLKRFIAESNARLGPGFVGEVKIREPLTKAKFESLQKRLPVALPESVREFLCEGAGGCHIEYEWVLTPAEREQALEAGLNERTLYGEVDLCDARRFGKWVRSCKAWANDTWVGDYEEEREHWENSIPVAAMLTGDYLAVQPTGEPDPPVVYLSHDSGSEAIAPSFSGFLQTWARLCYIGPDMCFLEPFIDSASRYLTPEGEHARKLRQLFRVPG